MNPIEIAGGILMILMCIAIVITVALQESPKGSGISALTGGDSYFNRNQGRTFDSMLAKCTKYLAIAFFILTVIVYAGDVFLP